MDPSNQYLLNLLWSISRRTRRYRQAFRALDRLFELSPRQEVQFFVGEDGTGYKYAPFIKFSERNHMYLLLIAASASILGLSIGFSYGALAAKAAVGALAFGVVATEVLYRAWLYAHAGIRGEYFAFPRQETEAQHLFAVMDKAIENYDPARGYDMDPNSTAVRVGIIGDRVVETHPVVTDGNGNVGFTDEEFSPSAINILILGDSYTSFPGNGAIADDLEGVEWPYFLKKKMTAEGLGPVRILNYGRSGHGILQMVDTAASVLDRYKPDIVVLAFIKRDLSRFRYWHVNRRIGGVFRGLRMQTPDTNAPVELCNDQYLIDDRITASWAQERLKLGDCDKLLRSLVKKYRRLRRRTSARAINLLSARRLYSWDHMFFSTPFIDIRLSPRVHWPKDGFISNYENDHKFVEAVAQIKASGAQIWPVYLPDSDELVKGEIIANPQESVLLKSLQKIVGRPVIVLKPMTTVDRALVAEKYQRYPHDGPPSAWAQELLADALVREIKGPLRSAFTKTF